MDIFIKEKIDTINLNIKCEMDESIIIQKRDYEMIELFPRVQAIFKILNIPETKFTMRERKLSSKVFFNYNGIYLEFKTIPPRPGQKINHSFKNLHLQIKGEYLLDNDFNYVVSKLVQINPDTYSKIDVAFDFIQEKCFLLDTMNVFLNHRHKIKKLDGENKIVFNLDSDTEQSIHYYSASKMFKIYNKALELKKNKKRDLFYQKNSEFLNQAHFRIELSLMKSKIINTNLKLTELINKNTKENDIIRKFKEYFFKDFYIEKNSLIKKILSQITK